MEGKVFSFPVIRLDLQILKEFSAENYIFLYNVFVAEACLSVPHLFLPEGEK